MHRPGPLNDLPLDLFLPFDGNSVSYTPAAGNFRSNKRPLPPGNHYILSPAKRRILSEEGVLHLGSTSKTPKTRTALDASARFSKVLKGPQSPAKVLNFGPPKRKPRLSNSDPVIPSLKTRSVSRRTPSPSPLPVPPNQLSLFDNDQIMDEQSTDFFSSSSITRVGNPTAVRDNFSPAPMDHRCIHYPGFIVHCDDKSTTGRFEDIPISKAEKNLNNDSFKENVPPRRKSEKVVTPNQTQVMALLEPDRKVHHTDRALRCKTTPKYIYGTEKPQPTGGTVPKRPRRRISGKKSLEKLSRDVRRGDVLNAL